MADSFSNENTDWGVSLEDELQEPRKFKVLLHNDDYSTMEFVIEVLMRIFHKSEPQAVQIMMAVHKQQIGLCGIYTYEVAETKVAQVHTMAKKRNFPLRCSMEEA